MRLTALPFLPLVFAMLLAACTPRPAADQTAAVSVAVAQTPTTSGHGTVDLNVFAAASLTEPFAEIGELFEADHPGVAVTFNFAGSQQLAQQVNDGAPVDVFASANQKQMDVVIQAGEVISGTQQTFVKNRLAVIYPQDNPAKLEELKDLARPGLKLVFAAQEVPVGQYTLDFLDKATADPAFGANYMEEVLNNVVSYEQNVKAVLTKVALGEADAGIVYTSDISGKDANKVARLDIPDALNVIASYPIAAVKEGEHPQLAQEFIDLVLSEEGQNILAKYNFIPVR